MGGDSTSATAKCGVLELMMFIAALIAGTCCSLTSKVYYAYIHIIQYVQYNWKLKLY